MQVVDDALSFDHLALRLIQLFHGFFVPLGYDTVRVFPLGQLFALHIDHLHELAVTVVKLFNFPLTFIEERLHLADGVNTVLRSF